MKSIGSIPRNRLAFLPSSLGVIHEYCFFLHDQCVGMLRDYEKGQGHIVKIPLKPVEIKRFTKLANATNPIDALDAIGYRDQSKRVAINTITIRMVSDCLHHIYEALRCFEKRKFIVGFNLLRKPLLDNLLYLSWALSREDEFYSVFNSGNVEELTQKKLGNIRKKIIEECIALKQLENILSASDLESALFSKTNEFGLNMYFQHAVHLITSQYEELKTAGGNFNFIFKHPTDSDDVYEDLYIYLPAILLYLSHVIEALFNRMTPMDEGAKTAFRLRSIYGYLLLCHDFSIEEFHAQYNSLYQIISNIHCENCNALIKLSRYNTAKILLTDSYKCQSCRKQTYFPFSWSI